MQAVGVEQILAFLVALDAAFGAADALARDAPQEPLALVAVSRFRRRPRLEVVRGGARDRVNQALERLLVDVHFLRKKSTANRRVRKGPIEAKWNTIK